MKSTFAADFYTAKSAGRHLAVKNNGFVYHLQKLGQALSRTPKSGAVFLGKFNN